MLLYVGTLSLNKLFKPTLGLGNQRRRNKLMCQLKGYILLKCYQHLTTTSQMHCFTGIKIQRRSAIKTATTEEEEKGRKKKHNETNG